MKKTITILIAFILIGLTNRNQAQTYDAIGLNDNGSTYDTIYYAGDTLSFNFTGLPGGYGYGNAMIEVTYFGYFGWGNQYFTPILPGGATLADIGGNVLSCTYNENVQTFAASDIDSWGTSAVIKLASNTNMQAYCYEPTRARVRLVFNYCAAGAPQAFADLDFTDVVCGTSGVQELTGMPAGGTFAGPNVSGTTFDPAGLSEGMYPITYTYTDGIGCTTSKTESIFVTVTTPGDLTVAVCEGSEPVLTPGGASYVFSPMPDLSLVFGTGESYAFPAVTQSPTTYFYGRYDVVNYYAIDTIMNDSAVVVDIDDIAGDDRGGIAITDSAVYMMGDDAAIRFDLDLLTPGVQLPIRDGIFTDLSQRKIYSLYNLNSETMPDNDIDDSFYANAIVALDADLNPTGTVIPLSTELHLSSDLTNSALFAGYGELLLYNGEDMHMQMIDLDLGYVRDLGYFEFDMYETENWANWGVSGYDGTDYTVYYRANSSDQIVAHNLTTGTIVPVAQFSDVSDLASFVTHPVNHRLYFHYEGGGEFGGSSETLGYVDMMDSSAVLAGGGSIGCASMATYTFNTVDLGNDTTVCGENGQLYILEAGADYQSYTWNGDNNNWNIFPVQNSGQYILEVVDELNCTIVDTINVTVVTVDCITGIDELSTTQLTAYPVPNKGVFNVSFGKGLSNARITLVNAQGVACFATAFSGTQQEAAINAPGLAAGVYFVQLTSDEGTARPITVIIE